MKKLSIVACGAVVFLMVGCGSNGGHQSSVTNGSELNSTNFNNVEMNNTEVNNSETNNSEINQTETNNTILNSSNTNSGYIYYGGGGNSQNTPTKENQIQKETEIGDNKVVISPVNTVNVSDKEAFTKSDIGIVAPVIFPKPEEVTTDEINDYNGTVSDVINTNIKDNNVYTISSAKVAPKVFSSEDKKLAAIFEFNPKLKFDTSIAITNYKSLLAVPNNGLDLLKKGLAPIPEISGDIAYYDVSGNRIFDINKEFNASDTSVDVYLLFKDINLTEGNYKLYMYDYNGNYTFKDIKVNKATSKLKMPINKISSFVIAKSANIININKTVDALPSYVKSVAIIALDDNNKVVGVGELKNSTVQVYCVKKPVKYTYVSYFLKGGKKDVDNLADISINDFDTDDYILDNSKLTETDKNIMENITGVHPYRYKWTQFANYIKPEKLLNNYENENFNVTLNHFIEDYLNNNSCNNNFENEYNTTYKILKVKTQTCNNSGLSLAVQVSYKDGNDFVENKSIKISKVVDNKYNVSYQDNVPNHRSDSVSYKLLMKPYGRIVKNFSEKYSEVETEEANSGYSYSKNITGKYIGDNNYLLTYNGDSKESYYVYDSYYSDEKELQTFSYDISGNALLNYNNKNENIILENEVYEASNIYSNDKNVTINGKTAVFSYTAKKLPKVLFSNYIEIGNEKVQMTDGNFTHTLTVNKNTNLLDFYHIKISSLDISEGTVTSSNPIKVALNAVVTDKKDRKIILQINDVELYQDDNGKTVVKIPKGTEIGLATNIPSLTESIEGDTVNTFINSDLINSDLDINVQTLINNVTAGQDKIKKMIDKFNEYLKSDNEYTININIQNKNSDLEWTTDLPKTDKGDYTINGEVNIVNKN